MTELMVFSHLAEGWNAEVWLRLPLHLDQPRYKLLRKRILAVGFLSASPERVAKDVDIGTPECEAFIASVLIMTNELVMLRARFGRVHIGSD